MTLLTDAIPTGPHGTAVRIDIPNIAKAGQTVDYWIVTAPGWHPLWSQYVIAAVRLDDDAPGFPPPTRHFDGATHELFVLALDPEHGPYGADEIRHYWEHPPLPILVPVNMAHQFIATDDELRQMCWNAVWAVVNGVLNPETAGNPTQIRDNWLASMTKTLAHIRGEVHAR